MGCELGVDGVPFTVAMSGYSAHLRAAVSPPQGELPDLILPSPLFPSAGLAGVREEYLTPRIDLTSDSPYSVAACGRAWDIDWFSRIQDTEVQRAPTQAAIEPVWLPPWKRETVEGGVWIPPCHEVMRLTEGLSSSSLLRRPGRPQDFVRGTLSQHPFLPGGVQGEEVGPSPDAAEWLEEMLSDTPLLTIPPGFVRGGKFGKWNPPHRPAPRVPPPQLQLDSLFDSPWQDLPEPPSTPAPAPDPVAEPEPEPEAGPPPPDPAPSDPYAEVLEELLQGRQDEWWQGPVGQKPRAPKAESQDQEWAVTTPMANLSSRFSELEPTMAMSFPFPLDSFQKEAVVRLESHDSVLVAAHTSAGKTVVAEYAFALASAHMTRAIYTSPIKSISNQKFRDFSAAFDVGLLTGDVSIRPEAPCLIMTTEVLRSMLYRGADLVRDVEWVVFDEVHYVNDAERGVVWEEVIIMLPAHVSLVLLSATVPNTAEFANWIGRTRKQKIYIMGTTKRPVPLEHFLYYGAQMYKVCEKEALLPEGIKAATAAYKAKTAPPVRPAQGNSGRGGAAGRGGVAGRGGGGSGTKAAMVAKAGSGGGGGGGGGRMGGEAPQWMSLVNMLSKNHLLPVVVFCFSKVKCDASADSLAGADLTTKMEKKDIVQFCNKGFSRLRGSDRQLPQVLRVCSLLQRGIGVHHAGLLPLVKEVVEMLFCQGVIKVLFSTETFAMGVNAPARSVAFHSLRKHDGKSFRPLLPGEYTQMAGRAGRRGLDAVGTVLLCCWDEVPDEASLKSLLTGKPTRLASQFRLTYTMILNLLRTEDLTVESMLKRSFAEHHAQRSLPQHLSKLAKGQQALQQSAAIECMFGEPTIGSYFDLAQEAGKLGADLQQHVVESRAGQQALLPGRCLMVQRKAEEGARLSCLLMGPYGEGANKNYLALTLPSLQEELTVSATPHKLPLKDGAVLGKGLHGVDVIPMDLPFVGQIGGRLYVIDRVKTCHIVSICQEKVQVNVAAMVKEGNEAERAALVERLHALLDTYSPLPPPALSLKDLRVVDVAVADKYRRREQVAAELALNPCHGCALLPDHFSAVRNRRAVEVEVKELQHKLSDAALRQMPDFHQRVRVLEALEFVDEDRVVQLKGRTACEMNSSDELIATELIFDGQLDELEPEEAVAVLSALVFQQKDASAPELTHRLREGRDRLWATALRLGAVQAGEELPLTPDEYAGGALNFGLMEVVYEWARGKPFAEICELTNVPEGTIVRTIVRLDETCREVGNAARIMGDASLIEKMAKASAAIKRDIVFAASLYVVKQ